MLPSTIITTPQSGNHSENAGDTTNGVGVAQCLDGNRYIKYILVVARGLCLIGFGSLSLDGVERAFGQNFLDGGITLSPTS